MLLNETEYLALMGYRHKPGRGRRMPSVERSAHRLNLLSADICGSGHQDLSPGIVTQALFLTMSPRS
jgi:hypothetical protein